MCDDEARPISELLLVLALFARHEHHARDNVTLIASYNLTIDGNSTARPLEEIQQQEFNNRPEIITLVAPECLLFRDYFSLSSFFCSSLRATITCMRAYKSHAHVYVCI
jgi:hypothetical protein